MILKRDVQLGKIALKAGFISKEQLSKCLALKKKLAKEKGKKVALGALLLKKAYLTKDQLEECVALHNKALEKQAAKGGAAESTEEAALKKKKKRRSKTSQRTEAASEDEAALKKKKRRKKTGEGDEGEGEGEAATATATATSTSARAPAADEEGKSGSARGKRRSRRSSKEEGRSRRSKKTRSKTSQRVRAESDIGSQVESAIEAVDPAIFKSAQDDEVETDTRRLIACPDCGKRYRIKRNQVGKRFNCRRCKHRIKVPKDLFSRKSELRPAAEVDDFDSGSGDGLVEEAVDMSKKVTSAKLGARDKSKAKGSVAAAAAAAKVAVGKVGDEDGLSLSALVAEAATHKAQPLRAQKTFGVKELASMAVIASILVAFMGGCYYLFVVKEAEKKALAQRERNEKQWVKYWDPMQVALTNAKDALKAKDPKGIGNAIQEIEGVRDTTKLRVLNIVELREKADAYELVEIKLPDLLRDYRVTQGKLYLEKGGQRNLGEGLRALESTLELEGVSDEVRLLVARTRIDQGRFREAGKGLSKVKSQAGYALRGMAYERGGSPIAAEKAYKKVEGNLSRVLIARAWLGGGSPQRAAQEAQAATGLSGLEQAAAKLVEGQALELRGDASGASRAYDLAVASGGESPIPLVARAEFNLRQNKPDSALKDADTARGKATTSRGLVARGDALLALLQVDKALATYREAASAPPYTPKLLVAETLDALAESTPPDYRVLARCRVAQVLAADGKLSQAQEEASAAVNLNPFEPLGLATLAAIGLELKSQGMDSYLDRALSLCTNDKKERIPSRVSAGVLLVHGAERVANSRYDEAIEALDLAVKLDPTLKAAANALAGQALTGKGLHSKAARRYLSAADAERRDASYKLLSERLKDVNAEKLGLFERQVLALISRNRAHSHAYIARGRARLAAEKPKLALEDANEAIKINPYLRQAYTTRAFLYLRDLPDAMRDADKGGKDIKAALKLEGVGGQAELLYGLALYHWQKGDEKSALASVEQCLTQDSDYADAYKLRADIYEFTGKKAEAARARERYEKLRKS